MELNLDSDNLKILSSIIGFVGGVTGVIGGILGFFTFIDNYILRFKPRLNISGGLFFFRRKPQAHTKR